MRLEREALRTQAVEPVALSWTLYREWSYGLRSSAKTGWLKLASSLP